MASEQDTALTLPVLGKLTYREIHAFQDGLYSGYVGKREHPYTQENHYWRMGYLLGEVGLRRLKPDDYQNQ